MQPLQPIRQTGAERPPALPQPALVLLLLTELDRYTAVCGVGHAQALAMRLVSAITAQQGPIVVVDAPRPRTQWSAARQQVDAALAVHPSVIHCWLDTDAGEPWLRVMARLGWTFHRHAIHTVRLGGCWARRTGRSGWVTVAAAALTAQGFASAVDPQLCAFEEDRRTPPQFMPHAGAQVAAHAGARQRSEQLRAAEEQQAAEEAFRRFLLLF